MRQPMRPTSLLLVALVAGATAAVAGLGTSGPGTTLAADQSAPQGAQSLTARQERAALAYWTAERKRAARPLEPGRPEQAQPLSGISDEPAGRPRQVAGSRPEGGGGASASSEATVVEAGVQPAGYTYPFPFTRRPLETPLYTLSSYRAVGRIYLRRGGVDFVCTGASVASSPRQVVFTAGNCLNDGAGSWSGNVIFVPAERGGAAPYGAFPARQLWVLDGWTRSADRTYDLGAFHVGRNALGQTLQSRVGTLGFSWSQSRNQHWDVLGYPAASPFNGTSMQVCEASHAVDDLGMPGLGPDPMGIGCDMTAGAAGSPWIRLLRRGSYVNGLTAYGYTTQPAAAYSPWFGSSANALRCAAATGEATATTC